jgi:hypothetical protein
MASTLYLKGIEQALLGAINLESDTIKLKYMATTYTPAPTTESYLSDVSASEASGAPTETLAGKDVRIDAANSRVEFDADNVTENAITCTTNKFIIYKDTGNAATSPLIACVDIAEGTLSPIAGTLAVTFNAEGIFAVTPS